MATHKVSDDARRSANLRLLQRSDSTVHDIVASATHVGLYEFQQTAKAWEKKNLEGSLFLVQKTVAPRFQLQLLNRNSTDNWTLPVLPKMLVQNQDPYLILRFQNEQGDSVIQGIWFYNGQERDSIASVLTKAIKSLELPTAEIDPATAASVLLSPLNLGGHTIPISRAPPPAVSSYADAAATGPAKATVEHLPPKQNQQPQQPLTPSRETPPQQHFVLDKKSLQLSLLSLIQDDRFLDLIHAQYLKVAHARANRNSDNGES
jgi:mRNA-decapping enzyme 1B